jgi:hypothetical protein
MFAVVVVEAVAIGLLALLVAGLLRSHAEILATLHEAGYSVGDPARPTGKTGRAQLPAPQRIPAGHVATDVVGTGVSGDPLAIAVTGRSHDTLLAFLSSGCYTCEPFWRGLAGDADVAADLRVVVVAKDIREESASTLAELAPAGTPVVLSSAAWSDYGVPGSPYFVLVEGATGRITGEGTGRDWAQVRSLFAQAAADGRRSARAGRLRPAADPADEELAAAGIGPGHPSLYQPAAPAAAPAAASVANEHR